MKITHLQGDVCDGLDTHESKYYKRGYTKATNGLFQAAIEICDPFARDCPWANHTNDIDPSTSATSHLDALEFLKTFEDGVMDVVLFDPPFSPVQAERRYGKGMLNIYTNGGYLSDVYFESSRVLKTGGMFLKLGYNSNRPHPTFDLVEMWITCFGGNRNDVIMTLWRKGQHRIDEYC